MRYSLITPTIDYQALSRRCAVYRLHRKSERFSYAEPLFDSLAAAGEQVVAVAFRGGHDLWVMLRCPVSHTNVRGLFSDFVSSYSDCSYQLVRLEQVDLPILCQMLLCSVACNPSSGLGASNIAGKLIVVSQWGRHIDRSKNGGSSVRVVHALEVLVAKDMSLRLDVRTYTSTALRKFDRKLSRYRLVNGRFMQREPNPQSQDAEDLFVQRAPSPTGRSSDWQFLDASGQDMSRFGVSKLGVLKAMLDRMAFVYAGVVKFDFSELPDSAWKGCNRSAKSSRDQVMRHVASVLSDSEINVVRMAATSSAYVDELSANLVAIAPQAHISTSRTVKSDAFNIVLVHEPSYYEEKKAKDPYGRQYPGCLVQHMTIETSPSGPVAQVLLKELVIARDIHDGRVSITDRLPSSGPWLFGMRIREKDAPDTFAFVRLFPDGSLTFFAPRTIVGIPDTCRCSAMALATHEASQCSVEAEDGSLNLITRTEFFGVPNFDLIGQALLCPPVPDGQPLPKHVISRSNEMRQLYFADAVDIGLAAVSDSRGYYRVGYHGNGMEFSATHKASVLREVVAVDGSRLLLEDIAQFLDVDFVRLGQPTVLPYPFKYLREYCKTVV